jgi:hypothetical protein
MTKRTEEMSIAELERLQVEIEAEIQNRYMEMA